MTNTLRRYLIAALTLLSVASLPRLSSAGDVYGTVTGYVDMSLLNDVNGDIVGVTSGVATATISFSFDPSVGGALVSLDNPMYPLTIDGLSRFSSSTPNSYYAEGFANPGYSGVALYDFSVTYQSISPDGAVVNANCSGDFYGFPDPGPDGAGTGVIVSLSFAGSSVPEPSSIALAATGALAILLYLTIRFTSSTSSSYSVARVLMSFSTEFFLKRTPLLVLMPRTRCSIRLTPSR
jgi:PEP-CTERM motif